jgi:hypothetical protein
LATDLDTPRKCPAAIRPAYRRDRIAEAMRSFSDGTALPASDNYLRPDTRLWYSTINEYREPSIENRASNLQIHDIHHRRK